MAVLVIVAVFGATLSVGPGAIGTAAAAGGTLGISIATGIDDGTSPFDADDNPGHDSGPSNNIVRTEDTVTYPWTIDLSGLGGADAPQNVVLEQTITSSDGATPYFDIMPAICGTGTNPSTGLPYAPQSSVTDVPGGQLLVCNIGALLENQSATFSVRAKVDGSSTNGSTVESEQVVRGYDENGIEGSTPGTFDNDAVTDVTVSALPNFDLEWLTYQWENITYRGGEPGFRNYWFFHINIPPGVGSEALADPITFNVDLDTVSPGPGQATGWVWDNNCQAWVGTGALPYPYDNGVYAQHRSLVDGGTVTCAQPGGAESTINVTVTGADTRGTRFPTESFTGNALSDNMVITGRVNTWVPVSAVDAADGIMGNNAGTLRVRLCSSDFSPLSLSGQANVGNDPANDCRERNLTIRVADSTQIYANEAVQNDASANDWMQSTTGHHQGTGTVHPDDRFSMWHHMTNVGVLPWENPIVCRTIDNALIRFEENPNAWADPNKLVEWRVLYTNMGTKADWVLEFASGSNGGTPGGWGIDHLSGGRNATTGLYQSADLSPLRSGSCFDEDADPTWGWTTQTELHDPVNGIPLDEITKYRIRPIDPSTTVFGAGGRIDSEPYIVARQLFNGGPNDGMEIPAGVLFQSNVRTHADNFNTTSGYNANTDGGSRGDRVIFSQVAVRTAIEPSFNVVNGAVLAGTKVRLTTEPSLEWYAETGGLQDARNVRSVVTLPDRLVYDPSCTTNPPDLVEFDTPTVGETRLTWFHGDHPVNATIAPQEFCVLVSPFSTEGEIIEVESVVSADNDASPEVLRRDTLELEIQTAGKLGVLKEVDSGYDTVNSDQVWTVSYLNGSPFQLAPLDVIDVLPFTGDGVGLGGRSQRNPGSDYSGTLALTGAPTSDVAGDLRYTSRNAFDVDFDPRADSNNGAGAAPTTWCLEADFGQPDCPTGWADVTAWRFTMSNDWTPVGQPGSNGEIVFTVQADGNAPGDTYSNRFGAFTPSIEALLLRSNTPTVVVPEYSVGDVLFADLNADGDRDAGEPGVPGVVVELRTSTDALVDSVTTDPNGRYLFDGLGSGTYRVVVPAAELSGSLNGWSVAPNPEADVDTDRNEAFDHHGALIGGRIETGLVTLEPVAGAAGLEPVSDDIAGIDPNTGDTRSNLTVDLAVVPPPELVIEKQICTTTVLADCDETDDGDWDEFLLADFGDVVRWRITLTNTGSTALTDVTATDALESGCDLASTTLVAGSSEVWTCDTALGAATVGFENSITASGDDPVSTSASDTDTAEVALPSSTPEARIFKEVCVSSALADCDLANDADWTATVAVPQGAPSHWRIRVSNTGNHNLVGVAVTDPNVPACDQAIGSLNIGATVVHGCTLDPVNADTTNTAEVDGRSVIDGTLVNDSASATVTVLESSLLVVKEVCTEADIATCDGSVDALWDETVAVPWDDDTAWRIRVTNDGAVPLSAVALTDAAESSCDTAIGALAVGETATVTCTTSNVQAQIDNEAVVVATPPFGANISDSDDATTTLVPASNAIQISKQVCTEATLAACDPADDDAWGESHSVATGGTVRWRIGIENLGNRPLSNVVVTDALEPNCDTTVAGGLPIGESTQYTCDTSPLTGAVPNSIAVASQDPDGAAVNHSDSASANVLIPDIEISKEICVVDPVANCDEADDADWAETAVAGWADTVRWRIIVENTGETDLTGVAVTDAVAPGCDRTIGGLAEADTSVYTCDLANITADATNTATVVGTPPAGANVSGNDTADVVLEAASPGVTITKQVCVEANVAACDTAVDADWGNTQSVPLDGPAAWRILVENTGNRPLTATVTDANEASCDWSGALAIGADHVIACQTASLAADVTNTATVSATDPDSTVVTATDSADATTLIPGVDVSKQVCIELNPADCDVAVAADWAETTTVAWDGTVVWRIEVANTGATALTDVTVTDAVEPSCDRTVGALAVGSSDVATCQTTAVQGPVANSASVSATPPFSAVLNDADGATLELVAADPAVSIVKHVCTEADVATCDVADDTMWGDTHAVALDGPVDWRIVVSNDGNRPLAGVAVSDPNEPTCNWTGSLAIGAQQVISCSTGALSADVTNTATVIGSDPDNTMVSASDTAEATVLVPSVAVTKQICTETVAIDCDPGDPTDWAATHALPWDGVAVWRIEVHNDGATPLSNVVATDLVEPSCAQTSASMAVGERVVWTCQTSGIQAAIDNTVEAIATPPFSAAETGAATASAVVIAAEPVIQLRKDTCVLEDLASCDVADDAHWAASTNRPQDGPATWRLVVTNAGNRPLDPVVVVDPVEPSCDWSGSLAIGESQAWICTTAEVSADTTNEASATGVTPDLTEVSATAQSVVIADLAAISVTKDICNRSDVDSCDPADDSMWANVLAADFDDTVEWRITVTNDGAVPLTGVTIADAVEPTCDAIVGALIPGDSVVMTCRTGMAGVDVVNEAVASGTPPFAAAVSSSDAASAELGGIDIAVDLVIDDMLLPPGGVTTGTITVSNPGAFDATAVQQELSLPTGLTLTSNGGALNFTGGSLAVDIADLIGLLEVGDTAVYTIELTTDPGLAPGTTLPVSSTVWTTVGDDVVAANDVSNGVITITDPEADLEIEIEGDRDRITVTVTHIGGPSPVSPVVVIPIPAGVTIDRLPDECTIADGEITCILGEFSPGDTQALVFDVSTSGGPTWAPTVSHSGTDPELPNNVAELTLDAPPPPAIAFTGRESGRLAGLSLLLLGAGGLFLLAARRRDDDESETTLGT